MIKTETKPGFKVDPEKLERKRKPVCNDPGYVRNAIRTPAVDPDDYKAFDVGEEIKVVCKEGFGFEEKFDGLIYCNADGKWDKLPRCACKFNVLFSIKM